jgi:DNA (cytosine-5)-methyltransferase 1
MTTPLMVSYVLFVELIYKVSQYIIRFFKGVILLKTLSLFSNVGIGETFLKENNIEVVVANELLEKRAEFYKHLYPNTNMVVGDITNNEIFNEIEYECAVNGIDLIIATPPCQGMSIAGKMKDDDPRNTLIIHVVKLIKSLKPTYVMIENVPRMPETYIVVDDKPIKIKDYLFEELNIYGYNINSKNVDFADYGVPQHRKRSITLISTKGIWEFPEKEKQITVREAIGHLPSLESGEKSNLKWHYAKQHNEQHINWLKHTPTGKSAFDNVKYYPQINGRKIKGFSTTYKRIEWDKPAPTITMSNGAISSQNNVHCGRLNSDGTYSDARTLTILELLILTTLPIDWDIPEWASDNFIRQVIGEAVPPLFFKKLTTNVNHL